MGFKFEFDDNGVSQSLSKAGTIIAGAGNGMLRQIGQVYVPALKSETPVAKINGGKLKNSARFQIVGGNKNQALEVRQGAKSQGGDFYGGFVRGGTRAHEIRPKKLGGRLVFQIGSVTVFAKKVNHPGTKANPYHKRALNQISDQIDAIQASTGVRIASELME